MKKPDIGIVVPVYKLKYEYFSQCIESLTRQTYDNIQIVLVDDCSPDECGKWCDEFAKTDDRIKVIHQAQNQGVSVARNSGVDNLQTVWTMFVDGDDWLELDTCQKLVDAINAWDKTPDVIMFSSFRNYPKAEVRNIPFFEKEKWFTTYEEREQLQQNCLRYICKDTEKGKESFDTCWGKLLRTQFLKEHNVRCVPIPHREDNIYYLHMTQAAERIVYVPEAFYHYRDTENSAVNRYRAKADIEQRMYIKELWEFLEKNDKKTEFVNLAYYTVLLSAQIVITNKFFHKDNPDPFYCRQKECTNYLSEEPYYTAFKTVNVSELRLAHRVKTLLIKLRAYQLVVIMRNLYNSIGK